MPCPLCPRKSRCVSPSGHQPSRYLAVGEAPGEFEDKRGIPFVGPAGREWDETYLDRAGLRREEIRVTNAVRCRPHLNRTPSRDLIESCAGWHLPEEIERTSPEVIFLMGATACSLVPEIQLEIVHGIPQWGKLYGWEGWICPVHHPALGLHQTGWMTAMLEDWTTLKGWLKSGKWVWPRPSNEVLDYRLLRTGDEFVKFLDAPITSLLAIDTESHQGEPWSIQFSFKPHTAGMVKLDDPPMRNLVQDWLRWVVKQGRTRLVFHNATADLPIMNGLGIDPGDYIDTMQQCYHLGNLPQGLKALGYRLFGVQMQSWEDLVGPYSRRELMEWMKAAITIEQSRPDITEKRLKTKVKVIEKPNAEERLLKRVIRHTLASLEYDPWQRLNGIRTVEDLGDYPRMGIKHCPEEEAVRYGCRDADMTLRLAMKLDELQEGIWNIPEEDWD